MGKDLHEVVELPVDVPDDQRWILNREQVGLIICVFLQHTEKSFELFDQLLKQR